MIKPIFIVKVPYDSQDELEIIWRNLEKKMTDYHVIVCLHDSLDMDFTVLYEKDFNEVKFEELKKIIKSSIKQP